MKEIRSSERAPMFLYFTSLFSASSPFSPFGFFFSLPFPSVCSRTPSLWLNSLGQAVKKEEGRRHCKQPFYLHGRIAPDVPIDFRWT